MNTDLQDIPHSYRRHASFLYETCLIRMCDMPHSYMRHPFLVWETCLIPICDIPHSYVRHASFVHATCLIRIIHMPSSYNSYPTHAVPFTTGRHCSGRSLYIYTYPHIYAYIYKYPLSLFMDNHTDSHNPGTWHLSLTVLSCTAFSFTWLHSTVLSAMGWLRLVGSLTW